MTDAELLSALLDEIDHLVLLPRAFHQYLHSRHLENLTPRECYEEMERVLKEEATKESRERIEALRFDESSLRGAVRSLENIVSVATNRNKREIMDLLRIAFEKIYDKVVRDLY